MLHLVPKAKHPLPTPPKPPQFSDEPASFPPWAFIPAGPLLECNYPYTHLVSFLISDISLKIISSEILSLNPHLGQIYLVYDLLALCC